MARSMRTAGAEFQLLEALRHNRRKREQQGQFLIEGVRSIDRAIVNRWPIAAVLTRSGGPRSRWATTVLASLEAVDHIELAPDLFLRLSDREEPPELILVGRLVERSLADLPRASDGLAVVVDRPSSPGNLGSIIRTTDALGGASVVVVGHAVHLYDPRTIRASVGSIFAVPACHVTGPRHLADWIEAWRAEAPLTVFVADEAGDGEVGAVALRRPAVVILGNEGTGVANSLRQLADTTLRIPMVGAASSLNVSVAHGILLYEFDRQRRRGDG